MNWEVRIMRSKTSFFNPTLFWKNVTRFWPLWAAYGLIWLVTEPISALTHWRSGDWPPAYSMDMVQSVSIQGVAMAVVFGVMFAMALFSYLYQSRSACMIHSMPVRRECLFLTNYLSGIAFFAVPNTVVALLMLLVQTVAGDPQPLLILAWWLALNGICLFFFSFAVFCAMFTGNILALPAFYGILNVLVLALAELVSYILSKSLYGFSTLYYPDKFTDPIRVFAPAWNLALASEWGFTNTTRYVMASPATIAAYAAAGVGFACLALVVYLRRNVETAGDVVAVSWMKPVFKYGVAICCGIALGMLTSEIIGLSHYGAGTWLCMIVWAAAGCFVAEMLLKKSLRVLRSGWKGAAIAAVAMMVLCAATAVDFTGFVDRVPAAEDVKRVLVEGVRSYPFDHAIQISSTFDQPEQIAEVIALHQAIVDEHNGAGPVNHDAPDPQPGSEEYATTPIHVTYTLAGGREMERSYSVQIYSRDKNTDGTVTHAAQNLLDDPEVIYRAYSLDEYADGEPASAILTGMRRAPGGEMEGDYAVEVPSACLEELWDAALLDIREGNLGRRYLFEAGERLDECYYNDLEFYVTKVVQNEDQELEAQGTYIDITLTPAARHTIAVLEENGLLDEVELILYRDVYNAGQAYYLNG